MLTRRSLTRFLRLGILAAAFGSLLAPANAQTGATTYMPMYNVKSSPYNATGLGSADDGPAIQAAINAAIATGGIVYFPEGFYLIKSPIPSTGGSFNLSNVILRGSAVGVSLLSPGPGDSITVTSSPTSGLLHGGTIENLEIQCTNGPGPSTDIGLVMQDSVGMKVHNVVFSRCYTGLLMQNVAGSTTGNDFDDVSLFNNAAGVEFDQSHVGAGGTDRYYDNSFRIWINTVPLTTGTPAGFLVNGGADVSNNTFNVIGNMNNPSLLFDAHTNAAEVNLMTNNSYILKAEPAQEAGEAYLFDGHAGGAGGTPATISGVAQIEDSCCDLAYPGTTKLYLSTLDSFGSSTTDPVTHYVWVPDPFDNSVAVDISPTTQLTITSSPSQTIDSPLIKGPGTPFSGYCFVTGDNASGAALAANATVTTATGSATITYTGSYTAPINVRLWCSQ